MTATTVMFDAYGTLFDVHSAVERAGAPLGPLAGPVSQMWRTKQLEYSWITTLMGGFDDFWTLTERGLDFALARHGISDPALRSALLAAYRTLDAYPDVVPALERLRRAAKATAIFTNGTRAMVDAAIAASGIGPLLDHVVTVEPVAAYKPVAAVYDHALRAAGVAAPGDIAFVSSNRWDVAGAATFGFRTFWINRTGMPDEYPGRDPEAVLTDLSGLAAALGA
ncbi:haloacid dehalogenase type II [Phreatobacter oligotrophus]|uniref:(S)-2-haloacid dehalogenase n=1 Tax=Phreatobacter oligotrophus TaxID=1122261 RepID=A0A2T4ZFJ7_9HYPH|nr:haloacid dehalogenase type II [Phreatobacter oligotrophus]PTM60694.1 2-haloacid dehalogenase [Phreatobacter oligotrophus]